jgi:sialic acid synthase SpsE
MDDNHSIDPSAENLSPGGELCVGGRRIGPDQPPYVIAEISANHEHERVRAEALVFAAALAGASAVKFQTFAPEDLAAPHVLVPQGYDLAHDQWLVALGVREFRDLFAHGGLPPAWHRPLKLLAEGLGLHFLSTPFSLAAAQFLVEDVGVPALKIASGDLPFTPLLRYVATTGLPVFLSTGGATLAEVEQAVTELWQPYMAGRLVLLHCVSHYPMAPEEANLRAIRTLAMSFPRAQVGWSDHSLSADLVPALAVREGACVIEKHLTWDRAEGRVDAGHSLTPAEFARMVRAVRGVRAMRGSGVKGPQPSEGHDRLWARRAAHDWLRPTPEAREGRWS